MWLEVGKTVDCMLEAGVSSQDVAGGRRDRGLYGGRNVLRARMWLEVGETEECMVQAMCKEPGFGWR